MLSAPLCGERRAAYCYVRSECAEAFEQYIAQPTGSDARAGASSPYLQGAFVALDPRTGAVRALLNTEEWGSYG